MCPFASASVLCTISAHRGYWVHAGLSCCDIFFVVELLLVGFSKSLTSSGQDFFSLEKKNRGECYCIIQQPTRSHKKPNIHTRETLLVLIVPPLAIPSQELGTLPAPACRCGCKTDSHPLTLGGSSTPPAWYRTHGLPSFGGMVGVLYLLHFSYLFLGWLCTAPLTPTQTSRRSISCSILGRLCTLPNKLRYRTLDPTCFQRGILVLYFHLAVSCRT